MTGIFRSVKDVVAEVWSNRARMLRVAAYDIKIENKNHYLGAFWKILTPLIRIGTYWFVFGIGLRGGAPIDGYPFVVWMLSGLIPWFFISKGITVGASSIKSKSSMLFKIKYPITTVPVGAVMRCLYDHIIFFIIMSVVFAFFGVYPSLSWLNLIYYILFSFAFLTSLSLSLSVLVMLAQDFANLINSLLSVLMFLTPILWRPNNLPPTVSTVLSLNPFQYIIFGFRDSFLYNINFYEHPLRMAFFWSMTLVLFLLGCFVQKKYANRLVDWM